MSLTCFNPLKGLSETLELTRAEQAGLRCHDQGPFVPLIRRADEALAARWPTQGDPVDERSDEAAQAHVEGRTLEALCGPFGREPTNAELMASRFRL